METKRKRRLWIRLLTFILAFSLIPFPVSAADAAGNREERQEVLKEEAQYEKRDDADASDTSDNGGEMARRRIVSKEAAMDCDGSGYGYYIITWSDGAVEYQDF